ncbi:hypothetical protein QBC39DRAFT_249393 [Podospora conica]|nr:hypothetical protein QBC39DRAFT_249393 [Schizothecium conicum]
MSSLGLPDQPDVRPQEYDSNPSVPRTTASQPREQGRSKYGNLDWDGHKPTIKSFYIDKDISLAETMKAMERDFSFRASQKAYKDQFDIWGWKKNLPKEIAHFMVENSKKRKKQKKDTVYTYGGKEWTTARAERTLSRAKAGLIQPECADGSTPNEVTYRTPHNPVASPFVIDAGENDTSSEESGSHTRSIITPHESDTDMVSAGIPLSYRGMSRTRLLSMWEVVRTSGDEITPENKKKMLEDVLDGLTHLQGATNEETTKVAYALAGFYVDTRQSDRADRILERQTQAHIESLGFADRKTLQHLLHVVELLNAWNRPEDAMGMLSKVREMSLSQPSTTTVSKTTKTLRGSTIPSGTDSFDQIVDLVSNHPTSANINLALSTARPAVKASDANTEKVLLAVIRQCMPHPQTLAPQLLRATGDLLSLYQRLGVQKDRHSEFQRAQIVVSSILGDYVLWSLTDFYGFEVVEAALEVVARLVKCGYMKEGTALFREIQEVGAAVFGSSDERQIWTLISIGLVYQTHATWEDAGVWFEGALAAALSATFDMQDGITLALQQALDRRHFSYVSDEGRPFRTVFGVSGMTIRPLRLHMD